VAPDPIVLTDEVRQALEASRPVVALETSVLSQGLPFPRNIDCARSMEREIRSRGAVPAWTAVIARSLRVGLDDELVDMLALTPDVAKVARRDLPAAVSSRGPGATTVSATLWAAHRAGIEIMATGGIGGVHPGSGDVSADLHELARTPGMVVCSGPKSIVDPRATLERLEELGVSVIGYGVDCLPFFLSREFNLPIEHRVDTPAQAAAVAMARRALGTEAAVLLCNPVPEAAAMDPAEVATAVAECDRRARAGGVRGKAVTPFLLSCLVEVTAGASLEANLALLGANAAVAADVAVALASADAASL
jgi:pseudouridine-5'-phosphate glycosidase